MCADRAEGPELAPATLRRIEGVSVQDVNDRCCYSGNRHKGVDFEDKNPHHPNLSPQPQPKKNLIAGRRLIDGLLKLHSTTCFSNLKPCGRRRELLKFL